MTNVKLPQFEGPLELLLELITAKKLQVNQISLAEVTDQYLRTISDMEAKSPGELADFLVVAATLLLLKSRTLLPSLALTPEEEESILSLEERLKEYQRYRAAGHTLDEYLRTPRMVFARDLWQGFHGGFFPGKRPPTANDLAASLGGVLETLALFFRPAETRTIARIATIEEKISEILGRMERAVKMSLADLTGTRSKAETILAFLALLFLFRQKTIMLSQSARFGNIEIRRSADGTV